MAQLIEYEGQVPVLIEVEALSRPRTGVRPAGIADAATTKVGVTLEQSLAVIASVGKAVRPALVDAGVSEAQVKIGLKASGTGQLIIAQSTLEGAIEVVFTVRAED